MKKLLLRTAVLAACVTTPALLSAQVGIGTVSPRPTAILDLTTTTRGFLPPRLTTAEKDALATTLAGAASPQDIGMIVYDKEVQALLVWNGKVFASPGGGFALPYSTVETTSAGTPLFRITNMGDSPIGLFELSSATGDPTAYAVNGQNNQANGGVGIRGYVSNGGNSSGVGVQGAAAGPKSYGGEFSNEADGIALRVPKGHTVLNGKLGIGVASPTAQIDINSMPGTTALSIAANNPSGQAAQIINTVTGGATSSLGLAVLALGGSNDNVAGRFISSFPASFNTALSVVSQNSTMGSTGIDLDVAAGAPTAKVVGVQSKATQTGTGEVVAFHANAIGPNSYALYGQSGRIYSAGNVGIRNANPTRALEVDGDVKLGTGSTPFSQMIYGRISLTQSLSAGGSSTTGLSAPGLTSSHYVVVTQKTFNSDIIVTYGASNGANQLLLNFRNIGTANFIGTIEVTYFAFLP